MNNTLNPCPAGHNNAEIVTDGVVDPPVHSVSCLEPGCWVGPAKDTPDEAIIAWNHRPVEEALQKRAQDAERLLVGDIRGADARLVAPVALALTQRDEAVKRAEAAESQLAEVQRQAAVMRDAIRAFIAHYEAKPGTPEAGLDILCMAINGLYAAVQPDAGRDYVPRAEVEWERERVAELEAQLGARTKAQLALLAQLETELKTTQEVKP